MSSPSSTPPPSPALVWWVLWAAFQIGIFVIYHFIGGGKSTHHGVEPALWQLAFLPVLISGAIRWSVFPLIQNTQKALGLFVVGIALAEFTCFLGLFIFPSHKLTLFIASAVGIFQFIPVYAGRFNGSTN